MKQEQIAKSGNHVSGIVIKQKVRFGKPVIQGTRIAVADILNLLRSGYRLDEIPEQYPGITVDEAEAGIRYAASVMGKEEILEIGSNNR